MQLFLTVRFDENTRREQPCEIRSSSTAETARLWLFWYCTCLESNDKCRVRQENEEMFTLDRLLEIRRNDNVNGCKWRLVCREDVGTAPYLTLNHCRGASLQLCLTMHDYSKFLEISADSRLSKTYRDAFQAAVSLDFQFICIDYLCIIQDGEEDWKTQSSMMGLVYAGAHCNIAVSWAADGSDDCFVNRDLSTMAYTTVTLSRENGETVEYTFSRSFPGYPTTVDVLLTTRAWVIQEKYQSKRQLSFLHHICWQCLEFSASGYHPTGSMDDSFLEMRLSTYEKPTMDINNYYDFQQTWVHLVHSYTACHLIQQPDKLIALAGLAGEMRKRISDEYLADMRQKDPIDQL